MHLSPAPPLRTHSACAPARSVTAAARNTLLHFCYGMLGEPGRHPYFWSDCKLLFQKAMWAISPANMQREVCLLDMVKYTSATLFIWLCFWRWQGRPLGFLAKAPQTVNLLHKLNVSDELTWVLCDTAPIGPVPVHAAAMWPFLMHATSFQGRTMWYWISTNDFSNIEASLYFYAMRYNHIG